MKRFALICLFLSPAWAVGLVANDLVVEDFEEPASDEAEAAKAKSWLEGEWTFEGTAFEGYGTSSGARINGRIAHWYPGQQNSGRLRTHGQLGQSLLKSWGRRGINVDGEKGRALSPAFRIERKFLSFLLSGGRYPGGTCVNLLVDDGKSFSATADNSNRMKAVAFDLSGLLGKTARIEVLDRETGAWGHLCVDQLVLTDSPGEARILKPIEVEGSDLVWSGGQRLKGTLRWTDDGLCVGTTPIDPRSVRSLSRQMGESARETSSGSVFFRNGERWRCEILSMEKGKLTLRSSLLGERTVELSSVRSLHFVPDPEADSPDSFRPGILYRVSASPVPGGIVWIKKEDLALDSPLGILPIPRTGLLRYLVPGSSPEPPSVSLDEVGLRDGSVFFGSVVLGPDKTILERPGEEPLSLPWQSVHYVIRSGKETFWLNGLAPSAEDSHGPLGPGSGVVRMDNRRGDETSLFALRLIPRTRLSYPIPPAFSSGRALLQAHLAPLPDSREAATFTVSVEGKEFFRRSLAPGSSPEKLSLPLPKGKEFTLGVEFQDRISYPCGVEMQDAHLALAESTKGDEPR